MRFNSVLDYYRETGAAIDALMENGKIQEAADLLLEAWSGAFPQYPAGQEVAEIVDINGGLAYILCRQLAQCHLALGNYEQALQWAARPLKIKDREHQDDLHILLGKIYLNIGDEANAYIHLHQAYLEGKHRAFRDEDKRLWALYKSYRG